MTNMETGAGSAAATAAAADIRESFCTPEIFVKALTIVCVISVCEIIKCPQLLRSRGQSSGNCFSTV